LLSASLRDDPLHRERLHRRKLTEMAVIGALDLPAPAKALQTYRERPADDTLSWQVKSILIARGMPTAGWEQHRAVVEDAVEWAEEVL
jgi:hypothetical protein